MEFLISQGFTFWSIVACGIFHQLFLAFPYCLQEKLFEDAQNNINELTDRIKMKDDQGIELIELTPCCLPIRMKIVIEFFACGSFNDNNFSILIIWFKKNTSQAYFITRYETSFSLSIYMRMFSTLTSHSYSHSSSLSELLISFVCQRKKNSTCTMEIDILSRIYEDFLN